MNNETYSVVMIRNVYHPDTQGMRTPRIAGDWSSGGDEKHEGLNLERAIEIIKNYDNNIYYTNNNESGRPDYYILEDSCAEYYTNGRNEDMGNYDWSGADCDCGECNKCISMMIDQDIEDIKKSALKM